ncbi:MAG: ABC transporter ATP-binding protein, partial [Finegoldia magna]|nr:ABC transporter ATP-binding protein [Finegoldia magna]
MSANKKILEVNNMHTAFRIKDDFYDAVDDVSFELYENEVLAMVGESGCGKSTLATTIMGLHNMNYTQISGEVIYNGENILNYTEAQFNDLRGGEIGMIFQDPLASLNPLMRIGEQIEEALFYHTDLDKKQRQEKAIDLLKKVGIENAEIIARQFPHQLSGGMRQRVIIAIALS